MIAALFVQAGGCYFGLPDVDPWDEKRDARLYAGPHPVVAHPPCARWCRLAGLVESRWGIKRGADDGCFASALASVRKWGGVLEHPAYSDAFAAYGIPRPVGPGWQRTIDGGAVAYVEQGRYGHLAKKATWLYAYGVDNLPSLDMGVIADNQSKALVSWCGNHTRSDDPRPRLSKKARSATPPAFRELLISIATSADMANRPPAFTGGTQANQSQAADSMRRTLRHSGGTTRGGSPASQAAWALPRCTE